MLGVVEIYLTLSMILCLSPRAGKPTDPPISPDRERGSFLSSSGP